jgi:hypothetical protein
LQFFWGGGVLVVGGACVGMQDDHLWFLEYVFAPGNGRGGQVVGLVVVDCQFFLSGLFMIDSFYMLGQI